MVFIGGPRQVGKTTFALSYLPGRSEKHPAYLNWDDIRVRPALMRGELPPKALSYFRERVEIPRLYQVHAGTRDYEKAGARVLPFAAFCREVSMP